MGHGRTALADCSHDCGTFYGRCLVERLLSRRSRCTQADTCDPGVRSLDHSAGVQPTQFIYMNEEGWP
jgi:hypothetical protein